MPISLLTQKESAYNGVLINFGLVIITGEVNKKLSRGIGISGFFFNKLDIDGLAQDCNNSSVLAMELL